MLRPRDTVTRETKRLDGIWSFTADLTRDRRPKMAAHELRRRWLDGD
jgi:hypothetical protein